MSCLRPDAMDLYFEGALSDAERRGFDEHLGVCPVCRRALEDRRAINLAFSSLPPIEVPPGFAAAVLARLPEEPRAAFGWLVSVATGTGVFLAGLLGYYLLTGESLAGVLVSVGRGVLGFVSLAAPFLAKVFKVFEVVFALAGDLAKLLAKGLGVISSLVSPEVMGLALLLGLTLALLLAVGVRKFVTQGERS
ncbi:MAG: zf-HC2 domain-containing protein [Candidatus Aminicenantales bacterium]